MLMNVRRRLQNQRGDTIVEVLICIAVISLVLGGAFVTTNRSLQNTRAAQERSAALKLAESQLEQIKGLLASNPDAILGAGAPASFCIVSGTTVVSSTNAACIVDTAGAPAAASVQPRFQLAITRAGDTFTVENSWTNPGGRGTDRVRLLYRTYRDQ